MSSRACPRCGDPLVQRPKERPGEFAARRHCSHRCAVTGPRTARVTRRCAPCGAEFEVTVASRRRFCSTGCQADAQRVDVGPRSCEQCGGEYRREHNVSTTQFGRRRFCSTRCAEQHREGARCRSGRHAMVGDNVGRNSAGKRYCRACRADRTDRTTTTARPRRRAVPPPPPPPQPGAPARPVWRPNAPGWAPIPTPTEESA